MSILVGIDPGLRSGAIGAIDHNGRHIFVCDIPADGDRICATGLKTIILRSVPADESFLICIEKVGVRPGQGISSSGRFMRAFGAIEAVAWICCDRVEMATPQAWKKELGLDADKEKSLTMAIELFPEADIRLKKHHGRAEALLIAEYARKVFL